MKDNLTNAGYSIDEVIKAITNWEMYIDLAKRDNAFAEGIIRCLNQGFCININREDYDNWVSKSPTYIHAYPAIFESDTIHPLKFVLIDSTSDLNALENLDEIYIKEFHYSESTDDNFTSAPFNTSISIPLTEALRRNFMWKMYCKEWLTEILTSTSESVFKALCIPFTDLMSLFQTTIPDPSVIAFLGLTNTFSDLQRPGQFSIEFILTNEFRNYDLPSTCYDISRPVPPFDGTIGLDPGDFSLLIDI